MALENYTGDGLNEDGVKQLRGLLKDTKEPGTDRETVAFIAGDILEASLGVFKNVNDIKIKKDVFAKNINIKITELGKVFSNEVANKIFPPAKEMLLNMYDRALQMQMDSKITVKHKPPTHGH